MFTSLLVCYLWPTPGRRGRHRRQDVLEKQFNRVKGIFNHLNAAVFQGLCVRSQKVPMNSAAGALLIFGSSLRAVHLFIELLLFQPSLLALTKPLHCSLHPPRLPPTPTKPPSTFFSHACCTGLGPKYTKSQWINKNPGGKVYKEKGWRTRNGMQAGREITETKGRFKCDEVGGLWRTDESQISATYYLLV